MSVEKKLATESILIEEIGIGVKALNGADKQFERVISVGDIHGCLDSLVFLIDNLKLTDKDLIIFLGDYVDRGPKSPGTIEYLLDLDKSKSCIFLRGNHDSMMLSFLGSGGIFGRYYTDSCNGGKTTLDQYKVSSIQTKYAGRETEPNHIRDYILEHKIPFSHMEFLKNTLMYFEMDHAFYSHAGFESNLYAPYDSQTEEAYTWTREGFLGRSHAKALKKHVMHGHTINRPDYVPYYIEQHKQINLDSGCFLHGTLSAFISYPSKEIKDGYFAVSNVENKTFELEKADGKYRK